MTWWARWRKRTCRCCACVYFVSWETGTSWKLCIYLRQRKAGVGRGSIKQFSTDLFTDTVAILNLLDLRSIIGCPKGHSLSIYRCFLGKKRTSLRLSQSRSLGFLVWCPVGAFARSRFALARSHSALVRSRFALTVALRAQKLDLWASLNFTVYFSGKRRSIIITSNTARTTIFFSH